MLTGSKAQTLESKAKNKPEFVFLTDRNLYCRERTGAEIRFHSYPLRIRRRDERNLANTV